MEDQLLKVLNYRRICFSSCPCQQGIKGKNTQATSLERSDSEQEKKGGAETKALAGKEEVLAGRTSRRDPSEKRISKFEGGTEKPVQTEKQSKQNKYIQLHHSRQVGGAHFKSNRYLMNSADPRSRSPEDTKLDETRPKQNTAGTPSFHLTNQRWGENLAEDNLSWQRMVQSSGSCSRTLVSSPLRDGFLTLYR